jgi:excisionase family DNA binding protein
MYPWTAMLAEKGEEMTQSRVLVPIPEAIHLLGISRSKIYQLMGDGELAHVKIGRRSLIVADSITRYVERLTADEAEGDPDGLQPRKEHRIRAEQAHGGHLAHISLRSAKVPKMRADIARQERGLAADIEEQEAGR